MPALGVDVGGTSLRVCAVAGGVRSKVLARPVPTRYEALLDAIGELAAELGAATTGPVVVGLPGATGPSVPTWIPALPWLDRRPLADDLADRLGATTVTLANDAQLGLLGEASEGAARGASNAALVSVGTGIGGAIMLGGRIVRGAHGTAGSFGWLPSAGYTPTPDHGGLELAASGRALDRMAGPGRAGRDVVAAALAGEPTARETLDTWASALGEGLAALASVLDPEIVVLAGGLCDAFDVYAEAMLSALRRAGSPDARHVSVVPAALGSHSQVVGASIAAMSGKVWS
ncbi:ROK family protein [Dactylosporangium sp. AC04546]|uniref:ROK family protein n=1 Tax=Dactylosporangium sp. AC04546 TaxID=2862460 RepID=UPI001EDD6493|nr:ROK family protein [Dactylosporangium sp. AC04546]WVK84219.1 ROK family protein [Dactylosporangium sp. AC04546]